jgi:hypothetical protein
MREDMDTDAETNYVACKVSEVVVGIYRVAGLMFINLI